MTARAPGSLFDRQLERIAAIECWTRERIEANSNLETLAVLVTVEEMIVKIAAETNHQLRAQMAKETIGRIGELRSLPRFA